MLLSLFASYKAMIQQLRADVFCGQSMDVCADNCTDCSEQCELSSIAQCTGHIQRGNPLAPVHGPEGHLKNIFERHADSPLLEGYWFDQDLSYHAHSWKEHTPKSRKKAVYFIKILMWEDICQISNEESTAYI